MKTVSLKNISFVLRNNVNLRIISFEVLPPNTNFDKEVKMIEDIELLPDYIVSPKNKKEIIIAVNDTFKLLLKYLFEYNSYLKYGDCNKIIEDNKLENYIEYYNFLLFNNFSDRIDAVKFNNWYKKQVRGNKLKKIISKI
jgi:hypothetical protein